MKTTLGGKLSMAVALIIAGCMGSMVLVGEGARDLQEFLEVVFLCFTWPLLRLHELFYPVQTDRTGIGHVILFLLLLIPYCFLVGYSIAGLVRLLRGARQPPPSAASEAEFKRLVSEHRKHDD